MATGTRRRETTIEICEVGQVWKSFHLTSKHGSCASGRGRGEPDCPRSGQAGRLDFRRERRLLAPPRENRAEAPENPWPDRGRRSAGGRIVSDSAKSDMIVHRGKRDTRNRGRPTHSSTERHGPGAPRNATRAASAPSTEHHRSNGARRGERRRRRSLVLHHSLNSRLNDRGKRSSRSRVLNIGSLVYDWIVGRLDRVGIGHH